LGHALVRNSGGQLSPIQVDVKYTSENAEYTYENCILNTYKFHIAQSDVVTISSEVFGTDRVPFVGNDFLSAGDTPQTRPIQWNDVFVSVIIGGNAVATGIVVRSFDFNINNNAERYYTLNGSLYPQAIAPRKRDLTGTVVFMGRITDISDRAYTNSIRCVEDSSVNFGFNIVTGNCGASLNVTLPNVVFQPEEIALTNDLFETTMQYRSLPSTNTQLINGITGMYVPFSVTN
jgi:hypothetical protein